jgi:uncharacterized circularly permuted ATP-grasp superfamily protein
MPRSLLSSYPKKTDRFDEMLAEDGSVRPSWQPFVAHLDAATPEQMRHRLDYVRRASSRTASPTTSMPTRAAPTGRGNSIPCR